MGLAGDLTVAHARIHQLMLEQKKRISEQAANELGQIAEQISEAIGSLQDIVTQAKRLPIGPVFSELTGVAERAARETGKAVLFLSEGEETELDRDLLAEMLEPLSRLVGMAVRRIESPAAREAAGKNARGTVRIRAENESQLAVIYLEDDGAGSADGREKEGGSEDVRFVREWLKRVNGLIDEDAERDGCTLVRLQLPLSAELLFGLLVKLRNQVYVIPMSNVAEIAEASAEEIRFPDGRQEYIWGERSIPLVWLHSLYRLPRVAKANERLPIVVAGSAEQRIALAVDEVLWSQEVRMDPLGSLVGRADGIAGTSLLPGGKLGLVVRVDEILELAGKAPDS